MSDIRTIKRIVKGKQATDGAGVKLVRVFGYHDVYDFDPFLMLDAFDSTDSNDYIRGFPWHPHRGIETITYLINGDIEHGDSLGNIGRILDGDCQWMTAGSGIIHQEMPKPCERMLGVQLWLNLPAKDKMTSPKYRDIVGSNIPMVDKEHCKVRIIAGTYEGAKGAMEGDYVKATYLDVELMPGCEWELKTEPDSTLFIYIIKGSACFVPGGDEYLSQKNAALFSHGALFWIKAAGEGIRFLLLSGKPLKEPIAWGGPIVMNTKEELEQAFKDLDEGSFIK